MAQYMISVHHEPGVHASGGGYEDAEALQAAHQRVMAFNERLASAGRMPFACGLLEPESATILAPGEEERPGPLNAEGWQLGGFWIVEADDDEAARALARDASDACGQLVELRRLQG